MAPAAAPAGARKVVTILFADLAGSTSQHERMDPESVRAFMEQYYAAMTVPVEAVGGRVIKLLGDGVMAAFGVPRVHEDDAKCAIRAAVAMQAGFVDLARRARDTFGTPIGLRVGINTGEVVVTPDDDDVVGDAVNVAARLEAAADPGEVVVGDSTYRLVHDEVTLEALPPLTLKGKVEPVRAWRVLSLDPPPTVAPAGATPFVGRDAELDRLRGFLADVEADGRTRLVSIIGSPGVGKSRLSRELAASLEGRARVFEVGCDPTGGATFTPIADLLRQAADLADDADADEVGAALLALLPEDEPERTRAAARAAGLLGAEPPGSPEETFWAVRRMLAAIARERPVVVILDDLHWAEPMLLDLVEHVAEWGRDAAVLLLALARPEVRDVRPSLAEGGRRVAGVVMLEGLGDEASQRLARDLLGAGDLPATVAERLLESTEGNPLFLRELIRMLVDDGVLARDGEAWTSTVDVAELDIPPTVHALLSARIERLSDDERLVIERAAVIGSQFPHGGVAALLPPDVARRLPEHLEALRRREFVEPEGTYWVDEPLYRFHHVLIRDAAYRGLLREARAGLHERYAGWLEQKAAENVADQAEPLGFHLEQAHKERLLLGGGDDDDLGGRAAIWLAAAGHKALERDDVGAAAALFGRAADCLGPDEPQRPLLLIERCESALAAGDVATGTATLEALRVAAGGDERLTAWADCFAGQLANLRDPSRLHETMAAVERAAERLDAADDRAGVAKAHGVRARSLAHLGRIAECEAALDKALAAARAAGDRRRANAVLGGAPVAALWGPSPVARASGRCLDVVRVLRITAGSPAVEATALRCQAVLEAYRGRDDAARRMLGAARASLEELGLHSGLLEIDLFAGIVELLAGDAVAAEQHLRQARAGFSERGIGIDAAQAAALLARALLVQGRDAEAEELTVESERLGGQDLKTAIAWRAARAEALARRGATSEAVAFAREAVAIAEPTDLIIDHADARTALARVLARAGDTAEASAEHRRASELYERKGASTTRPDGPAEPSTHVAEPVVARAAIADNEAIRAQRRAVAAAAVDRWDRVRALYADDIAFEDRRSGLRHEVRGIDDVVRALKYIHSIAIKFEVVPVATRGQRLGLMRLPWRGTDTSGGAFEGDHFFLTELDENNLVKRYALFDADDLDAAVGELDDRFERELGPEAERFPVDQLDDALRRYNQLRAPMAPALRNAAHDVDMLMLELAKAGKWDRFADLLSEGVSFDDRRWRMVVAGRREVVRSVRSVLQGDTEVEVEVVALRGDRLVLGRVHMGGTDDNNGPFEADYLEIVELDHDGRVCAAVQFDVDDLDAAFDELDDRFEAGEGADLAEVLRVGRRLVRAAVSRDWEAFRSALDDDFVFVDHGPTGLGTLSADEWVGAQVAIVGLSPDARPDIVAVDRFDRNLFLARVRTTGSGIGGGGPTEQHNYLVATVRKGLITRVERFPMEYLDEARRRFEELGAQPVVGSLEKAATRTSDRIIDAAIGHDWDALRFLLADDVGAALRRYEELTAEAPPNELENAATRLTSTLDSAMKAEDWPRLRAQLAPGIRRDDRRAGLRDVLVGADEYVKALQYVMSLAACFSPDVLAIRGDSLLLRSVRLFGGDTADADYEIDFLQLLEFDGDGKVATAVYFDLEDLDAAVEELDTRYAQGEAADYPDVVSFCTRFMAAYNSADWERSADLIHDDYYAVDRRPVSRPPEDKAGFLAHLRNIPETADARSMLTAIHRVGPSAVVATMADRGRGLGGAEFESVRHVVGLLRDGRFLRAETFPADRLVDALAFYEELIARAE